METNLVREIVLKSLLRVGDFLRKQAPLILIPLRKH